MADLSLRWAHRSVCWFCHAVARIAQNFLTVIIKVKHKEKTLKIMHDGSTLFFVCLFFLCFFLNKSVL